MPLDWRARDQRLRAFVHQHPSHAEQWVRAGIFDTYKTAARRAAKLAGRRRNGIRFVGGVQLNDSGRKHNVYCNGWRPATLLHEVRVTDEIIYFWRMDLDILRGAQVDSSLRPDFTLFFGSLAVHGEMDLDTEGYDQAARQMDRYAEAGQYNVWFAPTENRLRGLLRHANRYTLGSVCGSNVWTDPDGGRLPVERLGELFHSRSA